MALIIPTSSSSFGDGTKTSGRFQKYVLAQIRSDANLDWVNRVRSFLVKAELKYEDIKQNKYRLQKDAILWAQIEKGLGQATIIVVDPGEYEPLVRDTLQGVDIEKAGSESKAIVDACVSEVLSGTPIAYLPESIHRSVLWADQKSVTTLERFTPTEILNALGGELQHAIIFAARAHAVFDVPSLDSASRTTDAFRSPRAARLVLPEVLATIRHFDIENKKTVDLLNSAVDTIAKAVDEAFDGIGSISDDPLVIETDSRGYDEIQASDIAAGWAREMLEVADARSLGNKFERVWLNGRRLK
ncbi:MAG: hypothetical protein EB015_22160 [Methylocystaceae bacterium]|nr:hypothetical protein [Methylocystaceae bacterium]